MPTVAELAQQELDRRRVQQVSAFQSSYNPFNPNFRATVGSKLRELIDDSGIGGGYKQGLINAGNTIEAGIDFTPIVGDAVGVGDIRTSYNQGDMLGTGINTLAAAVGALPIVGDVAAKGVKSARSALRNIYHGTSPEAAKAIDELGFDLDMTADGSAWFTTNPDIGEVAAAGKGAVVQRQIDDSNLKLASFEETDKYSNGQLMDMGYDGAYYPDQEGGAHYEIWNQDKLNQLSPLTGLDMNPEARMQPRMLIPDAEEGRRRLYNAGTIGRDPQGYLEPHTSDWVKEVAEGSGYEGNIEDITSDLVYMSEKPDWVTSIIARDIGKDMADVTLDDVRRYGRLNIIDAEIDADEIFQIGDYSETRKIKDITGKERNIWDTSLYDDDRFDSLPIGPEPDDFISNEPQEITYTLTGDDLVDFLNENQPEMMQRLKGGAALSGKSALRGLDMNPEARMQRAQDLGFDTDNVFYHGTASDFAELQPSTVGDLGGGVYVTPNPEKASGYAAVRKFMKRQTNNAGPNVLPLRVKSNLNYLDLEGSSIMPFDETRIQSLKDQGYEGIRQFDADGNVIQMNIFDPKNIRSTNAEFDPTKADSADLLSSVGTTSALRGIA